MLSPKQAAQPNPSYPALCRQDTTSPWSTNAVPEVHLDYCFSRNQPGGKSAPTIVLKDRDAKALAAHVVPYKGGDLEWAVKQAGRDLIKW